MNEEKQVTMPLTVVFVLMLSLMGSGARADLISFYDFEEPNPFEDKISGVVGTVGANVTIESGTPLGNAALFPDGSRVDNDILVAQSDAPVIGLSDFTCMAWVRRATVTTDADGICDMVTGTTEGGFQMLLVADFRFGVGGPGNQWMLSRSVTQVTQDTDWHHYAVSVDRDEPAGLSMYIDGVLDSTVDPTGFASVSIAANQDFQIGSFNDLSLNGSLDELAILDTALTIEEIQKAMKGIGLIPELAADPNPRNATVNVPRDVVLSWSPGEFATRHNVYIGNTLEDVDNATIHNPLGVLASQGQDANFYDAGILEFGQTYYWRVDEVNGAPDFTVFRGDVWSFEVEPFSIPVTNITVTASSFAPDKGPENTIDESGLDDSGSLHGKAGDWTMWLTDIAGVQPTWIEFEFDKVYRLHEMWVWNYNDSLEPMIGFGFKNVSIDYSINGINYQPLDSVHEFAQGPGEPNYAHNTTVDFDGAPAKYVKLTANSNWGGIVNQYGLSEVRFFNVPVYTREPDPDSGAEDVSIGTMDEPTDVTLAFRAGREATEHNVYLSTDEQAVVDGTAGATVVTEARYGPLPLDLGATYYWRVDEVNEAETPTTWQGEVWNFTTQEFFVVDDFEDYNDYPPHEIYTTWEDGYEDPANGSTVGHLTPPSAETTIVHGGNQSMPFFYDNSAALYSEATMTLPTGRDWTIRGVGALSLWFRGYPASVGSFIETAAGTYAMTASGADIWGTSDQFHFAYKQLTGAGSIVARVDSVQNTNSWAKAGVMIRDTLDPDSVHAMVVATPSEGVSFERRRVAGESAVRTRTAGIVAPQWVKIERRTSGEVTASYSANGSSWTQLGVGSEVLTMDTPMYVGLALTAHNENAACEARFSNVQISGAVGAQWNHHDIGILTNDPEPMYIALANSGGTPALVYHPDPNATQAGTWTQWSINLDQFSQQGLSLTSVDELSVGFGDKTKPGLSGTGTVYVDDIRLCPYTEDVAPLLMAWYPLDEDVGDYSGNDTQGVLIGDPQWVDGKVGGALLFDGVDDYVEIQDAEALTPENFTIAFWVNPIDMDRVQITVAKKTQANVGGYSFNITSLAVGSRHWVQINGAWVNVTFSYTEDVWQHVAITYDGTTIKGYLNGQLMAATEAPGALNNDSGVLRIGADPRDTVSAYYNGAIDDVRIYDKAMSEEDIRKLAQ